MTSNASRNEAKNFHVVPKQNSQASTRPAPAPTREPTEILTTDSLQQVSLSPVSAADAAQVGQVNQPLTPPASDLSQVS